MKNKIIICGSRGFTNYNFVKKVLDKLLQNMPKDKYHLEIVSGDCASAERYAKEVLGFNEGDGLTLFPANWNKYKKSAGHFRNVDMSAYGTHCIAFWDGKSPGTKDMINQAEKRKLKLRVIEVKI